MDSKFGFLPILMTLLVSSLAVSQNINVQFWDAAWSHDGSYIAVGGAKNELMIFDGETFELTTVRQIGAWVQRLDWHPSGNLLAIATTDDSSQILDVRTGQNKILGIIGGTRALSWNRDGSLLASADYEKNLTVWNVRGEVVNHGVAKSGKSFTGISWHPEKNEFVTLSDSIRIFDSDFNLLSEFVHRPIPVLPLCVEWHPSGEFFAMGDYGYDSIPSLLQFWNLEGLIFSDPVSKAEYRNSRWSPDGETLATASDAIRLWNKDGKLLIETESPALLWGIDWSPDGKYLVTSDEVGRIAIWTADGEHVIDLIY